MHWFGSQLCAITHTWHTIITHVCISTQLRAKIIQLSERKTHIKRGQSGLNSILREMKTNKIHWEKNIRLLKQQPLLGAECWALPCSHMKDVRYWCAIRNYHPRKGLHLKRKKTPKIHAVQGWEPVYSSISKSLDIAKCNIHTTAAVVLR